MIMRMNWIVFNVYKNELSGIDDYKNELNDV